VRTGQLAHLVRLQGGAAIDGRVLRVGRALNPKTRLVDVDLAVPVDAAVSGEAFKASIQVGQLKGWKVPRASVLVDEKGPYIFQLAGTKAVRVGVRYWEVPRRRTSSKARSMLGGSWWSKAAIN